MYDLKNQTFVVLGFATIEDLYDGKHTGSISLQRPAIVEVTAVKISNGKIEGHYHSFVSIDGYDAENIEFGEGNYSSYNLNAEHLIGAPSFKEVIDRVRSYVGDSILLVESLYSVTQNPFTVFKDYAQSCGYAFNNPVITLNNILTAARLQSAIEESKVKFENAGTLQIAQMLACKKMNWADLFADYDIFFNPYSEDFDKGRHDPLSWALAFARLFITLVEWKNDTALQPIDEEAQF